MTCASNQSFKPNISFLCGWKKKKKKKANFFVKLKVIRNDGVCPLPLPTTRTHLCNVFSRSIVHANHCTLTCFPFFRFSPCESCRLQSSHHSVHSLFNVFTDPLMRPLTLESLFIYSSTLSHFLHYNNLKEKKCLHMCEARLRNMNEGKAFSTLEKVLICGLFFLCLCCFHQHDALEFVPPKSLNFCWIYI